MSQPELSSESVPGTQEVVQGEHRAQGVQGALDGTVAPSPTIPTVSSSIPPDVSLSSGNVGITTGAGGPNTSMSQGSATTNTIPSGSSTATPVATTPTTAVGQQPSIPTPTSSFTQTFVHTHSSVSAPLPSSSSSQPSSSQAPTTTSASASAFNYPLTLDTILVQITSINARTRPNLASLSHTLRGLPKESRDAILAGILPGGQDPLGALDVAVNTLGVLWILSARLTVQDAAIPQPEYILEFCRHFDPEQARMAPDRVTSLARGIVRYAARLYNDAWAIEPLYHLVTRYPPDGSYLTTIHPLFVTACAATRHFTVALPVLQTPITQVDTSLSDLTYLDNLKYHYVGGVALAALRRWDEAVDLFEICVASPATVPSAIQLEALKKLKLVQLISRGKISGLPRYAHQGLSRALKNTPYQAFINAYPHNTEQLQHIIDENRPLFAAEKNLGLITNAFHRSPRWTLKKLTATYLTLGLADIARAVKIDSEVQVRNLLLSMIEAKDISARISADGTVTFFDTTPEFSKEDVDRLLQDTQHQAEHLRYLEREMGKDREYLKKILKQKDDPMWSGGPMDDDLFSPGSGPGGSGPGWIDEPMYL